MTVLTIQRKGDEEKGDGGDANAKHTHSLTHSSQLEEEDNEFVYLKQDLQAKQTHANASHSDT